MHWLKFEFKLLFSSVAAKFGVAVVVLCALLAVYLGEQSFKLVVAEQKQSEQIFLQQLEDYKQQQQLPSAGRLGYYLFSPSRWELSPWAALFTGQSQTAYGSMQVRSLALQGQIHNREMLNPSWQKAGRLDLGFVLIYLLPVLIGILAVTQLSEEREANRWRLLSSIGKVSKQLIWRRLVLVSSTVLVMGWSMLIGAALWLSIPIDETVAWLMLALAGYIAFWAIVVGIIICQNKGSSFNGLSFITVWLVLAVLIPASVQLQMQHKFEQRPALHATLEQRMVMNDGWDKDKETSFANFIALYPQYSQFKLPEGSGSWEWYYAQQHMSDMAVAEFWQQHIQQEQNRFTHLKQMSYLSPSLMFQLVVNNVAGTGGEDWFNQLVRIEDYHREIREFLYDFLYSDNKIDLDALNSFPVFKADKPKRSFSAIYLLGILVFLFVCLYFVSQRISRLKV